MPNQKNVQRPVELTPQQAGLFWRLLVEKFGRENLLDGADAVRAIEAAAEPLDEKKEIAS